MSRGRRPAASTTTNGPLAPRVPFWEFITSILGIGAEGSKVNPSHMQASWWKSYDRRVAMTPDEAAAYVEGAGKPAWEVGGKAPPYMCICASRGAGKSLFLSAVALYEALTHPYVAQGGEHVAVTVVSPRVAQSKIILGYCKSFLERPALAPLVDSTTAETIRLKNGRVIKPVAVDRAGSGGRGSSNVAVILDEAGFLMSEGLQVAEEQWAAQLAGCRGVESPRALMSSSANGQSGFFYETHQETFGSVDSSFETFLLPQPLVRPDYSQTELQEFARAAGDDAFRREYLCDFSASTKSEKFFCKPHVESAVMQGVVDVPYEGPTVQHVVSCDPSGLRHDAATIAVLRREEDGSVTHCRLRVHDPKAGKDDLFEFIDELATTAREYGQTQVHGDPYGVGLLAEELRVRHGIEYVCHGFNNTNIGQYATNLRSLLSVGKVHLLDSPLLVREIVEFEKKTNQNGAVTLNHPMTKEGSSDALDAVMLGCFVLTGNDAVGSPPDALKVYSDKAFNDLYTSGIYPTPKRDRLILSAAEICDLGEGPRWIVQNWSRDWRYAQCAPSELSFLVGCAPYQWINHIGRDTLRQVLWMRWTLAYIAGGGAVERALNVQSFPAIPAWKEIKKRIRETGTLAGICTYAAGDYEDCRRPDGGWDLPPDIVRGVRGGGAAVSFDDSKGFSRVSAYPPWVRPNHQWGAFPHDDPIFDWPKRPWAEAVEHIFKRGDAERVEMATRAELLEQQHFDAIHEREKKQAEAKAEEKPQETFRTHSKVW